MFIGSEVNNMALLWERHELAPLDFYKHVAPPEQAQKCLIVFGVSCTMVREAKESQV